MNINFPIIELLDRLIIAKIKIDKGLDCQVEYDYYANQAKQFDLTAVKSLIHDLEETHLAIWALESDLRSGLENHLGYEEIGRRAIDIRNYNNQRVKIKNQLADALGDPIKEVKHDHISAENN